MPPVVCLVMFLCSPLVAFLYVITNNTYVVTSPLQVTYALPVVVRRVGRALNGQHSLLLLVVCMSGYSVISFTTLVLQITSWLGKYTQDLATPSVLSF